MTCRGEHLLSAISGNIYLSLPYNIFVKFFCMLLFVSFAQFQRVCFALIFFFRCCCFSRYGCLLASFYGNSIYSSLTSLFSNFNSLFSDGNCIIVNVVIGLFLIFIGSFVVTFTPPRLAPAAFPYETQSPWLFPMRVQNPKSKIQKSKICCEFVRAHLRTISCSSCHYFFALKMCPTI